MLTQGRYGRAYLLRGQILLCKRGQEKIKIISPVRLTTSKRIAASIHTQGGYPSGERDGRQERRTKSNAEVTSLAARVCTGGGGGGVPHPRFGAITFTTIPQQKY